MHMLTDTPMRVGRSWVFPNGKVLPVVSGGEGPEGEDVAAGTETGQADGASSGTPAGDSTAASGTSTSTGADMAAEVDKWKSLARANEKRAKENATAATELAKLRESAMSDQERAVEAARREGETAATSRLRERIITAEVKAKAATAAADPELVAMLVDRTSLVWQDDDTLDVASLEKAIAKVLKDRPVLAKSETPGAPKVPHGARGTEPDDLGSMSMSEFIAARNKPRS